MKKIKRQLFVFFVLLISFSIAIASGSDAPALSKAERAWLKEHPEIRLAIDNAWPPFEWIDDKQQYQGISSDYMRLIEETLGIRLLVEKDKPWPEVVEAVRQKQLDVFACVAKNPQREEYVTFTRPYLSFPMVIITTNKIRYIDGIKALSHLSVGVVKGYATHEYLAANHPQIKLTLVKTSKEGLEAVSQGRINAFVDNIATATTIITEAGLTNLKISGEMPIRYELSMAVRKDWPELAAILQKALDSISDEQRQTIQNKWIGIRYEHGFDYELARNIAIGFIAIIVFLYFYNRKLAHEVEQRKVAEEKATQARDEADKANQAKSEFLSVVSHELRTPLTSIKGSLGILNNAIVGEIPDKARQLLKIASENSDRLLLLIDDILDVEKLLAGKLTIHKTQVDITQLLNKASEANQGYAKNYDVHLLVKEDSCKGNQLYADEERLLQVLSNFISNAIKFSPKGGSVYIEGHCKQGKVRISVSDQGKGIPEEFRNRVFMPFSQADSSDTREKGGTGLGLAISKGIIDRHQGSIGFDSSEGAGACFYFELELMTV